MSSAAESPCTPQEGELHQENFVPIVMAAITFFTASFFFSSFMLLRSSLNSKISPTQSHRKHNEVSRGWKELDGRFYGMYIDYEPFLVVAKYFASAIVSKCKWQRSKRECSHRNVDTKKLRWVAFSLLLLAIEKRDCAEFRGRKMGSRPPGPSIDTS